MNKAQFTCFAYILIAFCAITSCISIKPSSALTQESETPVHTLSTTPSPIVSLTPTTMATETPALTCLDMELSSPLTDRQIEYFQGHTYNFLYRNDTKSLNNIFSVNRADTVCSPGYPSENFNVWKIVSGFIVDLKQPDTDLHYPGGDAGEMPFVNIYVKARFINQDGEEYEYWLQLTGNPPHLWFQLVRWDEIISGSTNEPGLTAMEIFMSEVNSDRTSSYIDASTMIPNGLLRVNDQFVAIVYVGMTNSNTGFRANNDILAKFVNAIEGKEEFPIAPDGFFLPVQTMIVPLQP